MSQQLEGGDQGMGENKSNFSRVARRHIYLHVQLPDFFLFVE